VEALFQAICKIGIFVICARTIVHFRARETYEKYLRLLVGIMVLIQLFWPVGTLLLGSGGQKGAEALTRLGRELEEGMRQAQEEAAAADALLEQMTLEEVNRRMEAQREGETQEAGGNAQDAGSGMQEAGGNAQDAGSGMQEKEWNAQNREEGTQETGGNAQSPDGGEQEPERNAQSPDGGEQEPKRNAQIPGGEAQDQGSAAASDEIIIEIAPVEPIVIEEDTGGF
jgi:hypothetical protein